MQHRRIDIDLGPAPPSSITKLTVPAFVAAALLANAAFVSWKFGHRDEKLDDVAETVKEIKADMYHQGDAARDLALRDSRLADHERRLQSLEARQQHREIKVEDDFLSRAGRWLNGASKPR